MIGLISKVGGLTKFVEIADKIKLLTRRLMQVALCLAKDNNFTLIDMLNGAIYTKVQSEFLTADQCQAIFTERRQAVVDSYKICLKNSLRSSAFNPLPAAR